MFIGVGIGGGCGGGCGGVVVNRKIEKKLMVLSLHNHETFACIVYCVLCIVYCVLCLL